jgi:hypothetical protein
MSVETLMTRNGLEDTGAELDKVKQERAAGIGVRKSVAVPMPTEDKTGGRAIA